ncbi:hypothetical protein WA588_000933 [Blastocystis sp. NMH]
MPSDVVYMPSQKKRWSVASCSSQSGSAVPFQDQRGVEYAPYISAHHYDSVYRSSPGYGESDLCRYSLPNRRSSRYLTSQESDEASILPKPSYSVAPTMFDGNGNYPEELFNLSSTPESPVNSSLDYKASIQDDPTIFHRGGGRRGGIRLGSGNLQDLSLLTMKPGETKTPLSSRSSLSHHRGQSPVSPTSRIHHLSLTKGLSSPMRAALEEDEALGDYVNSMVRMRRQFSDSAAVPNPVMSSSMSSSMNPVMNPVMSSSMNPCVNSINQTMNPSMNPSMNSSMNQTITQTITQPINPRINPSRQPRSPSLPFPNPQSPTSEEESLLPVPEPLQMSIHYDDIGNLLRVLLALSSKYDFSQLSIRMTCNACDLNPNALPNARLCYDFLNTGKCKRDAAGEVCRFRHLPPDHIDAIVDKIRNGKMPVCLIRQRGNQFLVADMPGYDPSLPGELNKFASLDADLCLDFNLTGRCRNEQMGRRCPLRHLVDCHPERIALLYRYGRMTEYEACAWMLYPCSDKEVNPFGNPHEKLCYDYLNTHVCKRNQEGKICRFRHCLPTHADALKDRLKNEKKVK